MNLDKEFCFPLDTSTSSTPSIFSAQSATSQYGNINSLSWLLNGFTGDSNQAGQTPMFSINDPMQLSHNAVYQPQNMEGFGFDHFPSSNFSPNYQTLQIQNAPLFEYSLQLDHHTPNIRLNNSLLNAPNCHDLNAEIPEDGQYRTVLPSSLPMENDKGLVGDNNKEGNGEGNVIKKKPRKRSTTKKRTPKSGSGGSNTQVPTGRRKGYKRKPKGTFSERSSMYRGVSRYTGRFEAFLWDNSDPSVKGRTVYIGGFEREEDAARAYDLAALKFWGRSAPLNFPIEDYEKELAAMQYVTKEEFLLKIRRKSKGFAKGLSNYRGVSRNSDGKKWQARLGKGKGLKGLYLGTFQTEVEAARAYDVAVLRMKGLHAITNFDLNHYDIKYILESSKLPIGKGASKMLKMTAVEEVIQLSRKTWNNRFPVLELQAQETPIISNLDHHDHQIIISDQPTPHAESQSFPSPATENAKKELDRQNPCSYLADSSPEMTGSSTFVGGVSDDHDDDQSIINGIENLELEDLQLFDQDRFYLHQNPSFDQSLHHHDYQMQNPGNDHGQLQRNPSFLNLFTSAGSGSRSNDDQKHAGNWTMSAEVGDQYDIDGDGASTDIFWNEFQRIGTTDFHDFFSHDHRNINEAEFPNLLQNPSFLDGFNRSTTQGGRGQ